MVLDNMSFPYSVFRKGQKEAISEIKRNLGRTIILKAPTGFGKTIVAILGFSDADRILYVVRTRNEITPVVKELINVGYPFTIIFSGRRMCPLLTKKDIPAEDFWLNCRLIRNKGMCPYYHRVDYVEPEDVMYIEKESGPEPKSITEALARKLGVCPFFALTKTVDESKYVVATYPYLFKDEIFRSAFGGIGLDSFYAIIDEAHTVLNPQSIYEEELDAYSVEQALKEVAKYGLGTELGNYLTSLLSVVKSVKSRLLKRLDKSMVVPGEGLIYMLEDGILEIRLKLLKEFIRDPNTILGLTTRLSRVVKFLKAATHPNFQIFGSVDEDGYPVIKAIPLGYEVIRERLSVVKGLLLMSGTMPYEPIMNKVLGTESIYIDIERDYGFRFPIQNTFYGVYTSVTSSYSQRKTEMYSAYAELLESVYEVVNEGVIFAVYPSYKFMMHVLDYLIGPDNQFVESRSSTLKDLKDVLKTSSKLLLHVVAGGKFAEGIELIDESGKSLIKVVIICGIPYPQPDDYVRLRREHLARTLSPQLAKLLVMDVAATMKVSQAVGRAIRSDQDRAFIVLADRRFLSSKIRSLLGISYDKVYTNLNTLSLDIRKFLEGFL
jgi:DNA excision repair protein ERCC-2